MGLLLALPSWGLADTVVLHLRGGGRDLLRTGRDRWWVVLGDVCGKGPAAAALTAAVRYTVRAERIGQALVGLTDSRLRDDLALLTLGHLTRLPRSSSTAPPHKVVPSASVSDATPPAGR